MGSVTGQSGRKVKRMRLIDADALEKEISVSHSMIDDYGIKTGYEICMRLVEDAPTIEPERTGKWIHSHGYTTIDGHDMFIICSECGHSYISLKDMRFCPNCGAKMEEPK